MMQDATFQLKNLNQELGKSVEKSRPYYEALKKAKQVSTRMINAESISKHQLTSQPFEPKPSG